MAWDDLEVAESSAIKILTTDTGEAGVVEELCGDANWMAGHYATASSAYMRAVSKAPSKTLGWQRAWTKAAISAWRADSQDSMDAVYKAVMGGQIARTDRGPIYAVDSDKNIASILGVIVGCKASRPDLVLRGVMDWDSVDDWPGADWAPKVELEQFNALGRAFVQGRSTKEVCAESGPIGKIIEAMVARYSLERPRFQPEAGLFSNLLARRHGSKWAETTLLLRSKSSPVPVLTT